MDICKILCKIRSKEQKFHISSLVQLSKAGIGPKAVLFWTTLRQVFTSYRNPPSARIFLAVIATAPSLSRNAQT